METQPKVSQKDNQESQQEQPPTSQRESSYLWGEVRRVAQEENKLVLEVRIDLTKTFTGSVGKQTVRGFFVEKGKSSVYEISEDNLVSPLELENEEEVAFEQISEGDKIALRCSLPPASIQEFLKYDNFTVSAVVVLE